MPGKIRKCLISELIPEPIHIHKSAFAQIVVIVNSNVIATETGLTGNKNNKIFKNQKMVIEIRGQQNSHFLPAVSYCFVLHIMYSSIAFVKQDTYYKTEPAEGDLCFNRFRAAIFQLVEFIGYQVSCSIKIYCC